MRQRSPFGLILLALMAFLTSLSLVAWRQSRALETLARLDSIREANRLVEAERVGLMGEIQLLERRGRVVSDASTKIGLRLPEADEIVYLPGDSGSDSR